MCVYILFVCVYVCISMYLFSQGDSHHRRGKLVMTSTGRFLFWELQVDQSKNAIEQRAYYTIFQCVHVGSVKDLKQMRISYYDSGRFGKYRKYLLINWFDVGYSVLL